jgi:predicted kinase
MQLTKPGQLRRFAADLQCEPHTQNLFRVGKMASIHLIEGPVGAGKSTFAADLARRVAGVHVPLDEWFVRLYSPDRPGSNVVDWYIERKHRLLDLIWNHALNLLSCGTSPVLELGLIRRVDRYSIYDRAKQAEAELLTYVLDAPRELRRHRVSRRNSEKGATFFMVVPDRVFETASDMWEPPETDEIAEQGIQHISTINASDG